MSYWLQYAILHKKSGKYVRSITTDRNKNEILTVVILEKDDVKPFLFPRFASAKARIRWLPDLYQKVSYEESCKNKGLNVLVYTKEKVKEEKAGVEYEIVPVETKIKRSLFSRLVSLVK